MQCTTYDAVLEDAMYDGREEFDDDSRARAVPTVLQTHVKNMLHATAERGLFRQCFKV